MAKLHLDAPIPARDFMSRTFAPAGPAPLRYANLWEHQKMQALIPRMIEGDVRQRVRDGYINATAMCKAAGKRFYDYHRLDTTTEFLRELEAEAGIPASEQIQTLKGGFPDLQGTWVHPQVAIHLAQWVSPRFAVRVSQWVYDWITETGKKKAELPFHLRRYLANYNSVPVAHFSVLTEMTLTLIAPLEVLGYTLPESMWPDISEGKMFASWLRQEYGIEAADLPSYRHVFEDGRRAVFARAYPEQLLGDFRRHVREVWMPTRSISYFKERDPGALAYLPRLLPPPKGKLD